MYLIFLKVELTNDGASAVTLYEDNSNGNLTDPYMFHGGSGNTECISKPLDEA